MPLKAAIQPIQYVLANFFHCVIILILSVNMIGQISGIGQSPHGKGEKEVAMWEEAVN